MRQPTRALRSCSPIRGRSVPRRSWRAPSTRSPAGSPRSRRLTSWPGRRQPWEADRIVTQVVFLLVPQVHLLDLAGPAQVFSTAADHGYGYRLRYVAEHDEVPTAQGIPIHAHTRWPEVSPTDLLIVPGWRSLSLRRTGQLSATSLARLVDHHRAGGTVASVCAGADALGRAGLLDGRRCTTHHDLQDELARRYPRATVVRDVLYVVDDRVVTSAGIASGIDLALHIIATRHGAAAAARIARAMVVFCRRN